MPTDRSGLDEATKVSERLCASAATGPRSHSSAAYDELSGLPAHERGSRTRPARLANVAWKASGFVCRRNLVDRAPRRTFTRGEAATC